MTKQPPTHFLQKHLNCYHCKKPVNSEQKFSFREECPHCKEDLHICFNCHFFDESSYNQCKESSAELVRDKARRNVCEYFLPARGNKLDGASQKEEQLRAAEALFKKK